MRKSFFAKAKDISNPTSKLLKSAISQCHAINEAATLNGVVDAKLYVFLAKNYYNMSDTQSISIQPPANQPNSSETYETIKNQLIIEGEEDKS